MCLSTIQWSDLHEILIQKLICSQIISQKVPFPKNLPQDPGSRDPKVLRALQMNWVTNYGISTAFVKYQIDQKIS